MTYDYYSKGGLNLYKPLCVSYDSIRGSIPILSQVRKISDLRIVDRMHTGVLHMLYVMSAYATCTSALLQFPNSGRIFIFEYIVETIVYFLPCEGTITFRLSFNRSNKYATIRYCCFLILNMVLLFEIMLLLYLIQFLCACYLFLVLLCFTLTAKISSKGLVGMGCFQ